MMKNTCKWKMLYFTRQAHFYEGIRMHLTWTVSSLFITNLTEIPLKYNTSCFTQLNCTQSSCLLLWTENVDCLLLIMIHMQVCLYFINQDKTNICGNLFFYIFQQKLSNDYNQKHFFLTCKASDKISRHHAFRTTTQMHTFRQTGICLQTFTHAFSPR